MDNLVINVKEKYSIVMIILLVVALVYLILKIVEMIRFINYGRPDRKIRTKIRDCKWKYYYTHQMGIKKFMCIRPSIKWRLDREHCPKDCKYKRFEELPQYEKIGVLKYLEQAIAIIASIYTAFKVMLEICEKW